MASQNTESRFSFLYFFYNIFFKDLDYWWLINRAQEPEPLGAKCFWLLGAGAARNKNQEPEPLGKKSQELDPEPLEKKSGAGAAKKFAGSPALIILTVSVVFIDGPHSPQHAAIQTGGRAAPHKIDILFSDQFCKVFIYYRKVWFCLCNICIQVENYYYWYTMGEVRGG